ncbi:MAG: hypothetical protein NC419_12380 [Muribaculaceae bacterium]|nr:hypothetical protein [Muribaculaceae bacterium]
MAIKRSFSVKNHKLSKCLNCGAKIPPDKLKDDSVYACARCGQGMTVDRYESHIVLTVVEKPDLRRRIPPEIMGMPLQYREDMLNLLREKEELKNQLIRANERIIKWQRAAEGLARTIEEMKTTQK